MTREAGTLWSENADEEPTDGDGLLSIGAVCDILRVDFPSVSISKIRYLEDQRLVTPRRTPGGYRLFSPQDVERLRTILRLQRDEFLPLRVIRQELESASATGAFTAVNQVRQLKRANLGDPVPTRRYSVEEVLDASGATRAVLRELQEYGLVGEGREGFDETEREVVRASVELAAYGVEPRHLRQFRVAADREAALLEQVLAVGLRSRNPERRQQALAELESLAALASHLRHLMLVSVLRRMIAP